MAVGWERPSPPLVIALHDPARAIVDNLERINRVVAFTCKRHGLGADDAEECRAWVALRLVENDYQIVRKFRGESSILTYLTVVVTMLVRDYRVQRWGRWRPSATALRLGSVATRLETLLYRDGLRLDDAIETMRSAHVSAPSERELRAVFAALPMRAPTRPRETEEQAVLALAGSATAEDRVVSAEQQAESHGLKQVVAEQLERLSVEDRTLVRLTFFDGLSVADVARGLGIPQKPLYRRLERLKQDLRERLQVAGVSRERAIAYLSEITT